MISEDMKRPEPDSAAERRAMKRPSLLGRFALMP